MLGWVGDVERATLDNETFRTVVFTGAHTQLTVMSLAPGEDIGREAHDHGDQFLRIELGSGGSSWAPPRTASTRPTTSATPGRRSSPPASGTTSSTPATASSSSTRSTLRPSTRTEPCTGRRRRPRSRAGTPRLGCGLTPSEGRRACP